LFFFFYFFYFFSFLFFLLLSRILSAISITRDENVRNGDVIADIKRQMKEHRDSH
jgi:hypothetical protein